MNTWVRGLKKKSEREREGNQRQDSGRVERGIKGIGKEKKRQG